MQGYQTRKIQFKELIRIDDWKVKVYTISMVGDFDHPVFYSNVKTELPKWLDQKNGFDPSNDKIGFLILHSGNEGLFSIINWWVGKNMLNTNIYFTEYEKLGEFRKISGNGLAPCIWELEVINHERISWMEHVLKNPEAQYEAYLYDTFEIEI